MPYSLKKFLRSPSVIIMAIFILVRAVFGTEKAEAEKVSCLSFETHAAAQTAFDTDPIFYKNLDRDKDGKACEVLP